MEQEMLVNIYRRKYFKPIEGGENWELLTVSDRDKSEILQEIRSQVCSNRRHQYQFGATIRKMRVGCSKKLCFIFISFWCVLADDVKTMGSDGNVEIKPWVLLKMSISDIKSISCISFLFWIFVFCTNLILISKDVFAS